MRRQKHTIKHIIRGIALALIIGFGFCAVPQLALAASEKYNLSLTGSLDYDAAYEVFTQVNAERSRLGLSQLKFDAELTQNAMQRAAEISVHFDHTRPNGERCFTAITGSYTSAAENIAYGQRSATEVMKGWINSPGHYNNIKHQSMTSIGIGCFYAENGVKHWVQLFTNNKSPVSVTQTGVVTQTMQVEVLTELVGPPKTPTAIPSATPRPAATPRPSTSPNPTSAPTKTPADTIPETGGWVQVSGKWFYIQDVQLVTGWKKIDNVWYYFNSGGIMQTGWLEDPKGTWYYLKPSGAMATGWALDGKTWYYLKPSGAMHTGWVHDGKAWYYLKPSGAMATGWIHDGKAWYYMNSSGAMHTGWLETPKGTWYYLKSSGAMAENETLRINVRAYNFNADGVWTK